MDDNGLIEGKAEGVLWGKIKPSLTDSDTQIGYLQVRGMGSIRDDLAKAFTYVHNTDVLIIDVRINSGGLDATGMDIASYLTEHKVHAFSHRVKSAEGWSVDVPKTYIEPQANESLRYSGRVFVLCSESTVSAGEVFVLAAKQLAQVTLMGRPTQGALSTVLEKKLPNGWSFGLSNEEYQDPSGAVYEGWGIPVSMNAKTGVLDKNDREAGVDSWLDQVIKTIELESTGSLTAAPSSASATNHPSSIPIKAPASASAGSKTMLGVATELAIPFAIVSMFM